MGIKILSCKEFLLLENTNDSAVFAKTNTERGPNESVKHYISRLFKNNFLIEVDGKQLFNLTQGRWGVVANIEGVSVPFYQSTSGTDSKVKGRWYPFFGDLGNWLIKGDSKESENGYGISSIKAVQDILNKNIKEFDAIATGGLISSEVLQNQSSLRDLDESLIKGNEKISINRRKTAERLASVLGYTYKQAKEAKTDYELFVLASKEVFTKLTIIQKM